jgi:hypothetical protein
MYARNVQVRQQPHKSLSDTIKYLYQLRPQGPWTFGAFAKDEDADNTFTMTTKDLNAGRIFLDAFNTGKHELLAGTYDIVVPVSSEGMMH